MKLDYIAVEGPIGVGKTTLARRLAADLNAELLSEDPDDVPFLDAFYAEPKRHALQTQLCFLLQRAQQIDGLRQGDLFRGRHVADFMFDKDPLFAELNLNGAELDIYREIFKRLAWQAPVPDRVIYLQASVPVLEQRIRRRNRTAERELETDYLARLCHAYNEFFASFRGAPVIWVDAERLDLVNNPEDYRCLLEALATPGPSQTLAVHRIDGLRIA